MNAHQCCGLCHQGKRLCPTPQACIQPEWEPDYAEAARYLLRGVYHALRLDWPVARMYWMQASDFVTRPPF